MAAELTKSLRRWADRRRGRTQSASRKPVRGTIRHDWEFAFIHIPKTAGRSIEKALGELPERPFAGRRATRAFPHTKGVELKRMTGEDVWERYFSFAFVRNPWDLMVSSYHWWLHKAGKFENRRAQQRAVLGLGSFEAFMHSKFGRLMINECPGSMLDWVQDETGALMVDFLGRFETLDRDWSTICQRLGAPYRPLPHENRIARAPYREFYNEETRAIVAERFHKEIELFGYEF